MRYMRRLTLIFARPNIFITATPSYCNWRRSYCRKIIKIKPVLQVLHTWKTSSTLSIATPRTRPVTSNTPASTAVISITAFLNLKLFASSHIIRIYLVLVTYWCLGRPSISKTTPFSCKRCAEYLIVWRLNELPAGPLKDKISHDSLHFNMWLSCDIPSSFG